MKGWSQNKILPNNSLGFNLGFLTKDAIFILSTLLDKYAKCGKKVYVCFIDFAKFCGTISHDHLFYKLLNIGICGDFYFILKDMYKNRSYAIKVDLPADASNPCSKQITAKSYRTKVFLCQMGLKQGCNLSPLSVNIYLADLHNILDENNKKGPILVDSLVGKAIKYVPFFKYLGVEFSQNCEFERVKNERLIKARYAIFSLRRILCTNGNVSPK